MIIVLCNLLLVKSQELTGLTYLDIGIKNQVNETASNTTSSISLTPPDPQNYIKGNFLKTSPSLISEMNSNTSQCLTTLHNIISYFSDYEQAALLISASRNTEHDRCFDCDVYKKYLPTAMEKYIVELSNQISENRVNRKNGFGCFINFTMSGMDPMLNSSLSETVLSYLYYYTETNVCISKFLQEMAKIMLERRRFFCTTINNMALMAINDTRGNIVGFKWTQRHADAMTNSLVQLASCINKERAVIPQTAVNALSTIALTDTCHISGLDGNTSSINSTNSTGPLPQGRRLYKTLRFLEENITTSANEADTDGSDINETLSDPTVTAGENNSIISNATSPEDTNNTTDSNNIFSEGETNTSNETLTPNATPSTPNNDTTDETLSEDNATTNRRDNATGRDVTNSSDFSSNNTSSITEINIAPAIPNLLLTTPGLNNIETFLNLSSGIKSIPVVINNLLNYTNDDTDIYKSISELANSIILKDNTLYTDLALKLNQSLLTSYSFTCMPEGPSIFLLSLKNNAQILSEFQKTNCTEGQDHIITITNGTIKCDNCDQSLFNNDISFNNRSSAPKEYYFSKGCINGTIFKFGSYKDFMGIPYASYERENISMDKVCLKKAFTCASNDNAQFCPQNFMKTTCKEKITTRCDSYGLFSTIKSVNNMDSNKSFVIPEECSLDKLSIILNNNITNATNNNNQTAHLPESYVRSCFNWFLTNVFINAYNPNVTKLKNLDSFFNTNSATLSARRIRRLQTASTDDQNLIIPESEDPTANDTIANSINDISLNSNVSSIDGANPNTDPESDVNDLLNTLPSTPNNAQPDSTQPNTQPEPMTQPEPTTQPGPTSQPQPGTLTTPYIPPNNSNYLYVHTCLNTFLVIFLFFLI